MKVCIIGGGTSNALEGHPGGGAEKQQALIMHGLKSRGINVIVLEYSLKDSKEINGIKFYPAWINSRKSFLSKLKNIISQIKVHDVNIVYARGTQIYVALLYLYLKASRSMVKLFWGIAGDHDLTSKFNYLRVNYTSSLYGKINKGILFNLSSILLFYFSDVIICQTNEQINMCRARSWRKRTVQIPNIYSRSFNNRIKLSKECAVDAIWVGKFNGTKGEDVLLKIAKDIPEMKIICLGHVTEKFANTITFQEIKKQENISLKGRVPYNEVSKYISKADFVLNTSPSEGFSNVFLEGWDQEKPVISLKVDPNRYLTKGEAGFCAQNSYSKLLVKIRGILNDTEFINYHGKKGKEILIKKHNPELIISQYEHLFLKYK